MQHDERPTPSIEEAIHAVCRDVESQVRGLVHRLMQTAGEERLAAIAEARRSAEEDVRRDVNAEIERALHEAAERLRHELAETNTAAEQRLVSEVVRIRAESERQIADEVRRSEEDAEARLAQALADAEAEANQRVNDATARARQEAEERLQPEVAHARAEAEHLRAELRRVQDDAGEQLQRQLEGARADADNRLQEELARVQRDADARAQQHEDLLRGRDEQIRDLESRAAAAHIAERQSGLRDVDRLLHAIRRLDEAQTLSEVLDTLAAAAADDADRVALMVAEGGRVQSWKASGFGDTRMNLAIDASGPVGRALRTGEVQTHPPFPGAPAESEFAPLEEGRVALAVPVQVGGRVVAVLYADDNADRDHAVPAAWPETLEILARHAGRALESLTARKAPQLGATYRPAASPIPAMPAYGGAGATPVGDDEARRYAHLLVSDVSRYNEAALTLGRQRRDLLQRLRPQIEQARRLYEEQVPPTVTARRLYFDQEVLRTLANGDPSVLG